MLWFYLSLLAAFLWGISAIVAKYVITEEMKDPIVGTTVGGLTRYIPFTFLFLVLPPVTSPLSAIAGFLGGVLYAFAAFFFYQATKREEISRVSPIILSSPLAVLLISTFFLGEILTPLRYTGIILIVVGSILISTKKGIKSKTNYAIIFALISMLLYALRNVSLDISTIGSEFFSVLPWVGIGGMTVSFIFIGFHHPHLKKKSWKGIEHIILSEIGTILALASFLYATSIEFVSLVTAVTSTEIFFVFIMAIILSKSHRHILREELKGSTLMIKGISIVSIFLGLLLII